MGRVLSLRTILNQARAEDGQLKARARPDSYGGNQKALEVLERKVAGDPAIEWFEGAW